MLSHSEYWDVIEDEERLNVWRPIEDYKPEYNYVALWDEMEERVLWAKKDGEYWKSRKGNVYDCVPTYFQRIFLPISSQPFNKKIYDGY